MKRIVSMLLLLTVVFSLSSCGRPSDVDEQHYNYGKKAIEIADKYLDYEISAQEAYNLIDDLRRREDELPDDDDRFSTNSHVETLVSLIYFNLNSLNDRYISSSTAKEKYQELLEHRNILSEELGGGKK